MFGIITNPNEEKMMFHKILTPTTPGVVVTGQGKSDNFVHIIKDPIRPYDIQVGLTRSIRKSGNPEAIQN